MEPKPGMRKVIISTNIAESSITIPDIYYVVDFLLTKEIYYDPVTKNENLMTSWASKASARQVSILSSLLLTSFIVSWLNRLSEKWNCI